jgi:integrase
MPHRPAPFYKPARRTWYVEVARIQHVLGKHPTGLPEPVKGKHGWNPPPDIWKEFHRKLAELSEETDAPALPPVPQLHYPFVSAVIDDFMGWLHGRVSEGSKASRTFDWYRDYLGSFLGYLRSLETPPPRDPTEPPALTIDQLTPSHIYGWVDNQPGWKTGKRGAMVAVQRAFNWAAKAGLLKSIGGRSPLAGLEKPAQGRRELLVTEKEYRDFLALVKDREFADLLELSWNTGARPHELFTLEADFVDLDNGCWTFPVKLSKGKKYQRVVYLNDRALEITRRRVAQGPAGVLLLNTEGRPWCVSSVKCRLQKLCRLIGRQRLAQEGRLPPKIPRLNARQRKDAAMRATHEERVLQRRRHINDLARQHGLRLNLYAFRHSHITESLVNGLDAVTVSVLAGHRDTTMISRVYGHLTQKHEHMRSAARKARSS